MNVLFLVTKKEYFTPDKPLQNQMHINIGVSYISSVLKISGHDTELFIITPETAYTSIDKSIEKFNPKLICFSSIASEYDLIKKTAYYIKSKYPEIYLLAGGSHPSLMPEEVIKDSFDAICIGEGEYPTKELADILDKGKNPTKIKNMWIKQGIKIQKNPTRPFLSNLDMLPFPDREIWQRWIYKRDTTHSILLGRGCPFECTFCSNHSFKKIAEGNYVRHRSTNNIICEIEHLISHFPKTEELLLEIETIGFNNDFAAKLCEELINFNSKKKKLAYSINLRISQNIDYESLFSDFKKANFKTINIGLESGCERIRKEVLNRCYTNSEIIKVSRAVKKFGLGLSFYVMIGLPTETYNDFKKTIEICRVCQPNSVMLGFFYPYPGTRLYNYCKKEGLLLELERDSERSLPSLKLKNFTFNQMKQEYVWFYFNVYFGRKNIFTLFKYTLRKAIYPNPLLLRFIRVLLKRIPLLSKFAE